MSEDNIHELTEKKRKPSLSMELSEIFLAAYQTNDQTFIRENYHDLSSEHWEQMPKTSSEACLLKLLSCLHSKKMCQEGDEENIEPLLEDLSSALMKEGFFQDDFDGSAEVINLFNEIRKNPLELFKIDFSTTVYQKFLQAIRPLDTNRLLVLLKHNKKAEFAISGKNVILLLGFTGAGKSTTTHHLCGSKFTTVKGFGDRVELEPVELLGKGMSNVKIGASATQSETRYVSAIPVIPSQIPGDTPNRPKDTYFICDTPGFLDSRGVEIQLANGQGIVDAVKHSTRVWPVILISKPSIGPRWMAFRQLMQTISKFMPNLETHLESFTYVFTHGWSTSEKETIFRDLTELRNGLNAQERSDSGFVALIEDMQRATTPGPNGWNGKAVMLNPLQPDWKAGDLLYCIVNRKGITDCASNFAYISSDECNRVIDAQMKIYELVVHVACNNMDFHLINYHITQLKKLKKLNQLKIGPRKLTGIVEKYLSDYSIENKEMMKNALLDSEIFCDNESKEREFHDACSRFELVLRNIDYANSILDDHFSDFDDFPNRSSIMGNLEEVITKQIQALFQSCGSTTTLDNVNFNLLSARLDRLKIFSGIFNGIWKSKYSEAIQLLTERYNGTVNVFQSFLSVWKLQECKDCLDIILSAKTYVPKHLRVDMYNDLLQVFKNNVLDKSTKLDKTWEAETAFLSSPAHLDILEEISSQLQSTVSLKGLNIHFANNEIDDIHSEFLEKVIKYVCRLVTHIGSAINLIDEQQLSSVKDKYDQLITIQSISALVNFAQFSSVVFAKTLEAQNILGSFVSTLVQQTRDNLPLLQQYKATFQTNKELASCLNTISEAKWIQDYRPTEFQSVQKLKQDIISVFESLNQSVQTLELSFDRPSNLIEAVELRKQLESSKPLTESKLLVDKVAELVSQALKELTEKRKAVTDTINKKIESLDDVKLTNVEQYVTPAFAKKVQTYFAVCKKTGRSEREKEVCDNFFKKFVSSYLKLVNEQLKEVFEKITAFITPTEDSDKNLRSLSNVLYRRLKELQEFKKEEIHKDYSSYFFDWCENPMTGLCSHVNRLLVIDLDRYKQNRDMDKIAIIINICSYLVVADHFLGDTDRNKYMDVRGDYVAALRECGGNIGDEIKNALDADEYEEAANLMRIMEGADQARFRGCKIQLQFKLNRLKEAIDNDATNLSRGFSFADFSVFKSNINKLRNAREAAENYINVRFFEETGDNYFVRIATNVFKFVTSNSEYVKEFLSINDFVSAQNCRNNADNALRQLEDAKLSWVRLNDTTDSIVEIKDLAILKNMDEMVKARLTELETKYDNMELSRYYHNQPDAVWRAMQPFTKMLAICWGKIAASIEKAVEQRLNFIQEKVEGLANKNYELNMVERAINTCPQDCQATLLANVEKCRKEIVSRSNTLLEKVNIACGNNNLKKVPVDLIAVCNEAKRFGHWDAERLVIDAIQKEINDCFINIELILKDPHTLSELIFYYEKLAEYQRLFEKELELHPAFSTFNKNITDILTKIINTTTRCLQEEEETPNSKTPIVLTPSKKIFACSTITPLHDKMTSYLSAFCFLNQIQTRDYYSTTFENYPTTFENTLQGVVINTVERICHALNNIKLSFIDAVDRGDHHKVISFYKMFYVVFEPYCKRLKTLSHPTSKLFQKFDSIWKLQDAAKYFSSNANMRQTFVSSCFEKERNNQTSNNDSRLSIYKKVDQCLNYLQHVAELVVESPEEEQLSSISVNRCPEEEQLSSDVSVNRLTEKIISFIRSLEADMSAILLNIDSSITVEMKDKFSHCFDQLTALKETMTEMNIAQVSRVTYESIKAITNDQIMRFVSKLSFLRRSSGSLEKEGKAQQETEKTLVGLNCSIGQLHEVFENPVKDEGQQEVVNTLIALHSMGQLHEVFENPVKDQVSSFIQSLNPNVVATVAQLLNESPTGFDLILCHAELFEASLNQLRIKETAHITIDDALRLFVEKNPGYKNSEKEKMAQNYSKFDSTFQNLINYKKVCKCKGGSTQYIQDSLIEPIKGILLRKKKVVVVVANQSPSVVDWSQTIQDIALELLPYIVAVKTIQSPCCSWLPHAVQILSILRILEADSDPLFDVMGIRKNCWPTEISLSNHLLQIGTGEGKSVTIAITAALFGLLGYDINCACYSKYLSQRDEDVFRPFFQALGINKSRIVYGTFAELAEAFINIHGDIRERISKCVKGQRPAESKQTPPHPKILLVDEVDTFLTPQFYETAYNPVATLDDPTIKAVVLYIWNVSKSDSNYSLTYDSVKASEPYKECEKVFKNWKLLIEREVRKMVVDVKTVRLNNHNKHFFNTETNRIGYKSNDSVTYSLSYGYQTQFLYFKECEERALPLEIALNKAAIKIDCGHFLYSEICKEFNGVMGVTGTLVDLTEKQKGALESIFSVKKRSIIPSAFGSRENGRFQFIRNSSEYLVLIENEAELNTGLIQEIERRMKSSPLGKRALIVFFKDERELLAFLNDSEGRLTDRGHRIQKMVESDTSTERNQRIRGAVVPGTVTFAVADFGRGTDFVCHDKELNLRGGVHIIQTFFSFEKSEEIQIQGRTARNTNSGSYSMVLLASKVAETFSKHLTVPQLLVFKSQGSLYDELHNIRLLRSDEAFNASKLNDADAIETHKHSMELRTANATAIRSYLNRS